MNDTTEDRLYPGFAVLAVLLPIVGYIQYFSWRKTTPTRASHVLVWAIIGTIINLALFA